MSSDNDRYVTSPLDGPTGLAEQLRKLDRRVGELEGVPLVGSNVTAYDAGGNELVVVGGLPDGTQGLLVRSTSAAWDLVRLTTAGWIKPHVMGQNYDPATYLSVTAGVYTLTYRVAFGEALGPGVEGYFTWATAAGTSGSARLTDNATGATNGHALGVASSGVVYCRWLHTVAVGAGPFMVDLEVERTGGAGAVTVSPLLAWVQDPALCSSAGTFL